MTDFRPKIGKRKLVIVETQNPKLPYIIGKDPLDSFHPSKEDLAEWEAAFLDAAGKGSQDSQKRYEDQPRDEKGEFASGKMAVEVLPTEATPPPTDSESTGSGSQGQEKLVSGNS